MAGNAFEWTNHWFKYKYYQKSPRKNPTGPKVGDDVNGPKKEHVIRGGAAFLNSWALRVAALLLLMILSIKLLGLDFVV